MKEETKKAIRSLQHRGKKVKRWEDCICGNTNVHSRECKRNHRKKFLKKYVIIRKEARHKLRKEHKCIICKEKVKPKIIYNQYCDYHKKQQDEYNKKLKEKKKTKHLNISI